MKSLTINPRYGVTLQGSLRQTEEELRRGAKAPHQRGGRMTKLYRHEVEAIRSDPRPTTTMAQVLGVSVGLIQRVRGVGKWAKDPYIPRDEMPVDKSVPHADVISTMIERLENERSIHVRAGRKFQSGRGPLTPDEQVMILTDPRPAWDIANELHLTVQFVQTFRRAKKSFFDYAKVINRAGVGTIVHDDRSYKVRSIAYKLPAKVIAELEDRAGRLAPADVLNPEVK